MTQPQEPNPQRNPRTAINPGTPRKKPSPARRGIGREILERVASPPRDAELLGFDQAMKVLDIRARSTIYKLIKQGLLSKIKILGATKFRAEDVRRLQNGAAQS